MAQNTVSFKYQLEKEQPKVLPGGITRGASVNEFPASQNLAGVSMHLDSGAIREMHWHANAAEWGYVVTGQMRTTLIDPEGNVYVDLFNAGDVWYFPRGFGHCLQCVGTDACHFILIFDNGDFSEDHTFSVTDFISSVPADVAAKCLGITKQKYHSFHKKKCILPTANCPAYTMASHKGEKPTTSPPRIAIH